MKKNPLITDFPPLPSRDLIMNTAANPPVYQGQPVSSGGSSGGPPVFIHPPFIPIGIGPGGAVVGGATGGGGNVVRNPVGPVRGVGANPKNPGGKVNKNPGANHSVVANQVNANVAANPNANPKNPGRKIKKKPAPNPVVPAPGH
jgi:hypothetical protein